jgi:hypothetical protein
MPTLKGHSTVSSAAAWVDVDLSAATLVDANSVVASGSFASGTFTTAATASDTRSTGGDPLRLEHTITEDLTGVMGIAVELTGVDFTKADNTGFVVQVVDDADPSAGAGMSWHWVASGSTWRCAARAAFGAPVLTNPGVTTPTSLLGDARIWRNSSSAAQIGIPMATLRDSDDESGTGRATSTAVATLSGTGGLVLVLALQQLAAARSYTFTGLRYQLIMEPS